MQIFGNGSHIYVSISNSNCTGSFYFSNQSISPFTCTYFANFSQAGFSISSSLRLVLSNASICTHIQATGNISFPNNGLAIKWGNNHTQIYDNMNLHICTHDTLYIHVPTSCIITSPNTSLSGRLASTYIACNSIQISST